MWHCVIPLDPTSESSPLLNVNFWGFQNFFHLLFINMLILFIVMHFAFYLHVVSILSKFVLSFLLSFIFYFFFSFLYFFSLPSQIFFFPMFFSCSFLFTISSSL